jgi:hypothetical protein
VSNTFDAATHTYAIEGRKVPSVTQVLNDLIPGFKAGEWYLNRGQAVHACAALIAQGVEFEHDPAIDGQVRAVRRFFAEVKPVVLSVEKQVYSARYQYAGTLDLFGLVDLRTMVVDFKASESAALPYQLAAYSIALPPEQLTRYGCGVIINEDGSYKMTKVFDLRLYQQSFLALLTAYNIRRQAGIKEGEAE